MHQLLVEWIGYVAPWIELLGIAFVVWAVLEALVSLARRSRSLSAQRAARRDVSAVRLAMGEKMVLGLEFFLAGDIVQTIVIPTWEPLAILAGIVAIRTVLVYFPNLELRAGGETWQRMTRRAAFMGTRWRPREH